VTAASKVQLREKDSEKESVYTDSTEEVTENERGKTCVKKIVVNIVSLKKKDVLLKDLQEEFLLLSKN
jgi:hypothetical protein